MIVDPPKRRKRQDVLRKLGIWGQWRVDEERGEKKRSRKTYSSIKTILK